MGSQKAPTITVEDNLDITTATPGWARVTPEGCGVHVLQSNLDCDIVVMCQRGEDGEPWVGYVLTYAYSGGPYNLIGGIINYDEESGKAIYVDLQKQLDDLFDSWP